MSAKDCKVDILTKEQLKHYDSVKWLFFGQRRSGRTLLLASIFVDVALRDIGNWIYITDHYLPANQRNEINHIFGMINDIFYIINDDEKKYKIYFRAREKAIKIEFNPYRKITMPEFTTCWSGSFK